MDGMCELGGLSGHGQQSTNCGITVGCRVGSTTVIDLTMDDEQEELMLPSQACLCSTSEVSVRNLCTGMVSEAADVPIRKYRFVIRAAAYIPI